jgi:hypothetical protein
VKTMNWMPVGTVDQIEKFKFAIKQANKAIGELERQKREWQESLNEQARSFLATHGIEGDLWFDLEHGWDCPESPIGVCVYDRDDYSDCCEICGNPDERK